MLGLASLERSLDPHELIKQREGKARRLNIHKSSRNGEIRSARYATQDGNCSRTPDFCECPNLSRTLEGVRAATLAPLMAESMKRAQLK
jgi:hypothetical protein